jgi:hypothetical protein
MRLFASRLQNAFYNGWTCSHYCSNILTFAPNGTIIHAIINAPGLWHDSNIEERLYQKLMTDTLLGYCFAEEKNEQLVSARQAAEWGMWAIQGSFSCLKLPMPTLDHKFCTEVIELTVHLHQLQCQLVGINQTAAVYQEVKDDFSLLSQSFHNMMFPQIQKKCQISQYYNSWC